MTDEFPWLQRAGFGRARVLEETDDEIRFQFWSDGEAAPDEEDFTVAKTYFYQHYAWCVAQEQPS